MTDAAFVMKRTVGKCKQTSSYVIRKRMKKWSVALIFIITATTTNFVITSIIMTTTIIITITIIKHTKHRQDLKRHKL